MTSSNGKITVTNNFATLPVQTCRRVHVVNVTGLTIEVRQDSEGVALPIPTGFGFTFRGITNASQLEIRRQTAGVGVDVFYRMEG